MIIKKILKNIKSNIEILSHFRRKQENFYEAKNYGLNIKFKEMKEELNKFNGKILLYPVDKNFSEEERAKEFFDKLSSTGDFFCIFCEYNEIEDYAFRKISNNFYVVNNESNIFPLIEGKEVIIYAKNYDQAQIYAQLTKRSLWFDLTNEIQKIINKKSVFSLKTKQVLVLSDLLTSENNETNFIKNKTSFILKSEKDCKKLTNKLLNLETDNKKLEKSFLKISALKKMKRKLADKYKTINKMKNNVNLTFENGKIIVVSNGIKNIQEKLHDILETIQIVYLDKKIMRTSDFVNILSNKSFILIGKNTESLSKHLSYVHIDNDESMLDNIKEILNSKDGLQLYSNYNNKNNINVKASTFFNDEGTNYYSGGAERYLIDLHEVCKEMNVNLDIYQNSTIPFFKKYRDINVIGIVNKSSNKYSDKFLADQAEKFKYISINNSQLNIYSAFYEGYKNALSPSIGISHGVAWDNRMAKIVNANYFWKRNYKYINSAQVCDKVVSVDTNTANWFQTIDFNIGNKKIKVIPNYVDIEEFKPKSVKKISKKDKIIITYPRRLYEPRGLFITLDTSEKLLKEYNNIEIHFVGKGFKEDTDRVQKLIDKYPKSVKMYSMAPERMNEVYKNTDISLIPTLYSEGTSLSCLEAMASGNVVISTRIGGLTDLIINNYNGFLIEPTSLDLYNSLKYAIENIEKLDSVRKNAIAVAETFNKKAWKEKWKNLIETQLINKQESKNIELVEFYLYDTIDISKEIINMIREKLCENKLVYLRNYNFDKDNKLISGRLQEINFNDEMVSEPVEIYYDKRLNGIVELKKEYIKI